MSVHDDVRQETLFTDGSTKEDVLMEKQSSEMVGNDEQNDKAGNGKNEKKRRTSMRTASPIGSSIAVVKSLNITNGYFSGVNMADALRVKTINDLADLVRKSEEEDSRIIAKEETGVTTIKNKEEVTQRPYNAEYAHLPENRNTLLIRFEGSMMYHIDNLHSVDFEVLKNIRQLGFFDVLKQGVLDFVIPRLVDNLMSGIWGSRNYNESAHTLVMVRTDDNVLYRSDMPDDIAALKQKMLDRYAARSPLFFQVFGFFQRGIDGLGEVFPSQLMDASKGAGRKFYRVAGDCVGFRAVKIGNRLRVMDDLYDRYEELGFVNVIEPMGYNMRFRAALREKSEWLPVILESVLSGGDESHALMADQKRMHYLAAIFFFGALITSSAEAEKE